MPVERKPALRQHWRVGGREGNAAHALYTDDGEHIGMLATPDLALAAAGGHNRDLNLVERVVVLDSRGARQHDAVQPMATFEDAEAWCETVAADYGSVHAAMVDLLFAPGESYEDAWLAKLWDVAEYVRAQPCECTRQMVDDLDTCRRCAVLNLTRSGR